MTLTPEQAAEQIIGKDNIFAVVTFADIDRWYPDGGTFSFTRYLLDNKIRPCPTCGAYRHADKCGVCEKVEAL